MPNPAREIILETVESSLYCLSLYAAAWEFLHAGEMETSGRGLLYNEFDRSKEVLLCQEL